jgi:Dolichyl-phosphate-mannose-protein mannosyltransferase
VLAVADTLAIGVLVIVAAIAALTFRDYGLGWDDYAHAQYGDLLLALYGSGFADRRALSFVNLYMYGGAFDALAALLAKVVPFGLFEARRLTGAIVGIAGLIVTWRMARRVAGPTGGLIALVLLATCPLYYGHMFMNAKDVPFAVAMALLLLSLVRAFTEYPQPTPATVALFGIGLGVTIGSRVIGGMAGLYAATAVALILVVEARESGLRAAAERLGRFILALLPGLLLAYLVMGLVWPWAVVDPLNPLRSLEYFSVFFEKPWKELFAGVPVAVPDMPRSYLLTLLALQMPEIFLVLTFAGTVLAFVAAARRDVPVSQRASLLLLAVAATLPIAIAVVTRPAMYNGIRHFAFVTPPLAVLGGLAGARLFEWLARYGRAAVTAAVVVLGLGLALPVIEFVRLHPYQYTHFNNIAGRVPGAGGRYMRDYWGLSFRQAAQALRAKLAERGETPPAGRWRIAVCGPHPPAQVVLGPQFETTWDPKGADFALMLGEFYCARLDAPVLAEIAREGVVYARAYDVRGRMIDSLFTLPPVE